MLIGFQQGIGVLAAEWFGKDGITVIIVEDEQVAVATVRGGIELACLVCLDFVGFNNGREHVVRFLSTAIGKSLRSVNRW